MIKWLDDATVFFLCGIIFTLPFSKSMVEIFFMCALVFWAIKKILQVLPLFSFRKDLQSPNVSINSPIYVFIAVGFLSMLNSVSINVSLEGFFFKLLEWTLLYFICVDTINTEKRLKRILITIFFSVYLIVFDAIFQIFARRDFLRGYALSGRMQASFTTSNSFAAWIITILPAIIIFSWFWKDALLCLWDRYKSVKGFAISFMWILTSSLAICLYLTYTRGPWLAFFASLIFMGIILRKGAFATIALIILILIIALQPFDKLRGFSTMKSSVLIRLDLWQEAAHIIKDFPILGTGVNTYANIARKYQIFGNTGIYPHNCYLQMAAEMGLFGLGVFLWTIISLFKMSLANLKKISSKPYHLLLIGLLAGLAGFLMHSFVDVNFYSLQLGVLMWFMMGLIMAVQKIGLEKSA